MGILNYRVHVVFNYCSFISEWHYAHHSLFLIQSMAHWYKRWIACSLFGRWQCNCCKQVLVKTCLL